MRRRCISPGLPSLWAIPLDVFPHEDAQCQQCPWAVLPQVPAGRAAVSLPAGLLTRTLFASCFIFSLFIVFSSPEKIIQMNIQFYSFELKKKKANHLTLLNAYLLNRAC